MPVPVNVTLFGGRVFADRNSALVRRGDGGELLLTAHKQIISQTDPVRSPEMLPKLPRG